MRSIYRTALTTLALALAASAIMASAASAAPEWYSSSTPATAEWQQGGKALPETRATSWKGRIWITDSTAEATVECESTAEGSVAVGAAGKVTAWTFSKCVLVKAGSCTKLENIKADGLPWTTGLAYSRGKATNVVKGETSPGFQFTCTVAGIKIVNKCTVPSFTTAATNGTGGVGENFAAEVTCVGSDKGRIEGSQTVEATTGGKLEVAGKEGPFTKLSSSLEVERNGKLTIEDHGGPKFAVTCHVRTTGTIEPAGKGTIKSYFVTGCEASSNCALESASVVAINLPWKTELGGAIDESIVSGGNGTPAWGFTCMLAGERWTDRCNLNVSPSMLNGPLGNVDALFLEDKVNCSLDTHEGEGAWSGELAVEHPASVAEIAVK